MIVTERRGRVCGHGRRSARTVPLPTPRRRRELWRVALEAEPAASDAGVIAIAQRELAQHFRLPAAVVTPSRASWRALGAPDAAALRRLCRERSRVGLRRHSRERDRDAASWDDLVLPDGQLELLREIVRHVRHRTQVYERWGFAPTALARARRHRALRRRERHGQDAWRPRCSPRELGLDLYRIDLVRDGEQVHRRDREEPLAASSTRPRRAAPCCSSTRRTRSSASAARSRTATTATRTSRSPTCCSAWSRTAGSRS